jgi:hypothetical protein
MTYHTAEVNMKILIGITQDLDATKRNLSAHYRGLGTSTEAGPFITREEALNWQNFMMNRRDNYEEIKTQATSTGADYWFGITVESPELH